MEGIARDLVKFAIESIERWLPRNLASAFRMFLGTRLPFPTFRNELLIREILGELLENNSICIDIGANVGKFASNLILNSPDGKLYCFEPNPELSSSLRTRLHQANVEIFDIALSDSSGRGSFFINRRMHALSGLSARSRDRDSREILEIEVVLDTLDCVLRDAMRIDFIKIDVEGAELKVLRGASDLIEKTRPVIWCEFNQDGAGSFGVHPEEFYNFVGQNMNYSIFTARGWLERSKPLTLDEFAKHYVQGDEADFLFWPIERPLD